MSLDFDDRTFISLENRDDNVYLAHGAAANVWKVPPSTKRPERVTKVLRISSERLIGDQLTNTTRSQNRKNLWQIFVQEYTTKVKCWSTLSHPNVLWVFGYGDGLNLEVEYHENGCVRDFLKTVQGDIGVTAMIADVLAGLAYLHDRDPPVVHGGLNTGKLFVGREGHLIIGEFGLSTLCSAFSAYVPMISFTGLTRWLSPEMLDTEDVVTPTTAADIWAMGCIMLEIGTGVLPYSKYKHDIKIQREILAKRLPGEYDSTSNIRFLPTIWSLMEKCWEFLPDDRPTASSLSEDFDARCRRQGPTPAWPTPSVSNSDTNSTSLDFVPSLLSSNTTHSSYPTSSTEKIMAISSSQMSVAEIIAHLGRHGCRNLTHYLDTTSFSKGPVNRGGVGEIHQGRLNDGRRVAIKTIFLRTDEDERDQKYLKHAVQELHTWSKCRHRNVVPLLGVAEFRGQIVMLFPWMENGTLHNYVNREPSADRCDLSAQVAQGLAYLHSIGIVHGDLKGANVLVSFDGIAALTDFDNAILGDTTLQFTKTGAKERMSIRWTAPEILTGEGECSPEADVYALGMTILETLTGNVPYFGKNENAVMFSVGVNKEFPKRPEEHISSSSARGDILWSMLINCWWHDPQERPRAESVYELMKTITPGDLVSRSEI